MVSWGWLGGQDAAALATPLTKHWGRRRRGHPEHERLWHLLLAFLNKMTMYGFNIMSLTEADIGEVETWSVNGSRPTIPMNISTYIPKDKPLFFLQLLQKTRPGHPVCDTATGRTATILTIEANYNYPYRDLMLLELITFGWEYPD